jgi:hypothetical protein
MALTPTISPLRRLVPREAEPPKGALTRIFEFLDLPKNVVQNLAAGNIGGAGRNLADIVTGVTGLRLIPGLNKTLELSREQDRPTLGLVLDILTDPLTWISFGGAGAAKTLSKAGFTGLAKAAGKKVGQIGASAAGKILSTQLTKAGAKRLALEAGEAVARRIAARPGGFLATVAKRAPGKAAQIARQRILSKAAPAVAQGLLPDVFKSIGQRALRQGGIRVGLPFTAGRTVALAGRDPLAAIGKAFVPLQVGKRIPGVKEAVGAIQDVLRPVRKATVVGKRVQRRFLNRSAELIQHWKGRTADAFKNLDETTAKRIGKTLLSVNPTDPDGVAKVAARMASEFATEPQKLAQATETLKQWRGMAKDMLGEAIDMGTITGSRIPPEMYMSLQWTDEFAEAMQNAARGTGPGATAATRFDKMRKFLDPTEFVKRFGEEALETDIRKLAVKRTASHAHSMAKGQLFRQSNTLLGRSVSKAQKVLEASRRTARQTSRAAQKALERARTAPALNPLGKRIAIHEAAVLGGEAAEAARRLVKAEQVATRRALDLRPLVDSVLEEWIKTGAGKLKPRGKVGKLLADYNRMFFKGPVTVGLGPVPNIAFVTRNAVSGVFQALTDEDIGLAGVRHLPTLLDGMMAKVAGAFGWKHHGVTNKLVQGATEGVQFAGRTGDDLLAAARRNNVMQAGFAAAEFAPDIGVRGQGVLPRFERLLKQPRLQKFNFARQATEYTESAMRMNAWLDLVRQGVDDAEAAKKVADAFIDYRVASAGERTLRDVIPFAKFTVEQTPRTLEAIARRPVLTQPLRALAAARGPSEGPLPPFLEGRPTISLGEQQPGVESILGQFGTPVEDLQRLGTGEGLARTVEQTVLGGLTPAIKLPLQLATGREFFRGRPLEELTRAPAFLPEAAVTGVGGRVEQTPFGERRTVPWQLNVTFQNLPVTRQLRQIDKIMSDRQSVWVKTLDIITGAKVYDVDKDRELRRRIRDYLQQKAAQGDIGAVNRFFAKGDTDPVLTDLIKQYYKVGKR